MIGASERLGIERGLVGKAIVGFMIFVVVAGVAAMDTGSILFARFRVASLAQQASFDAAGVFKNTRNRQQACATAEQDVREGDGLAKIPLPKGCVINTLTGAVTIIVRKTASTLVAKRLSFLRKFTKVQAIDTSPAPP